MVDGASRLQAFLKAHGLSQVAAAGDLGVSGPTVHDWVTGAKRPKGHHREAIAVWTHGQVPAESWLRDDERAVMAGVKPFAGADESGAHPTAAVKAG